MKDTNKKNIEYWQREYHAPNVESWVFRTYGRILKKHIKNGSRVLDYGCGEGATVGFYLSLGMDAHGVDVCAKSIETCKKKFPDHADNFHLIKETADIKDIFKNKFDLIVCNQVIYYLDNANRTELIDTMYELCNQNGLVHVTFMSYECSQYYKKAKYVNNGMWEVKMTTERYETKDYYINFVFGKKDIESIMNPFIKLEIGQYSEEYIESEGLGHHYNYVGMKYTI